jgi:hypothetical protein
MAEQEKKILSKFEWFLLIIALGILAMVILQNQGIHVIETVENVELKAANELENRSERPIKTRETTKQSPNKDRLESLAAYFAQNRATAKSEGKRTDFNWSSLKLPDDEKDYLKNRYQDEDSSNSNTDWLDLLSKSHKTYKSVKSIFNDLGIDTDKVINAENASKALSNPIIANSIYQKIEDDFGIPAEKSRSFATKHRQTLEKWSQFVEQELEK